MNSTASIKNRFRFLFRRLKGRRGNAIVYVAMVLIIFGVIGAVMTALLTSSVVSTTTPNHSRRALYMTEAGMRYGLSELRNEQFAAGVINDLNNLTYTVSAEETFTLNVFGPWFNSASDQEFTSGGVMTVNLPEGKLPDPAEFSIPAGVWAVNMDYTGDVRPSQTTMRDPVTSYARLDDTTLNLTVSNDLTVAAGERVCLGVQPTQTQPISEGSDLYITREAKDYFPHYNGAVEISRRNYAYERLEDDAANNRAILRNLSYNALPNSEPALTTVEIQNNGHYTGDWIILSPRNYTVIPTGTSESISAGGTMSEAVSTYDQYAAKAGARKPDIDADEFTSNISELETPVAGYISTDTDADSLSMGGNYNPPASAFGAAWYDADKSIGGDNNYCQAGACLFERGFRAFFTLDYSGDGDGLTFSVINSDTNSSGAVGGDTELSELLGYAGDSRLDVAGTTFLDSAGNGLRPPKLALEFDNQVNDETLIYCADATSLNGNTRNDPRTNPLNNDRDVAQYVFWGLNDLLGEVPCRNDDPSYDDNQHNAGESEESWSYATGSNGISSPIVGSDGTIYVGSGDSRLYALNPDGSEKWSFLTGGAVRSSPNIAADGTIYVGSDDGRVYAINPDGSQKWNFLVGATISKGRPAIGPGGTIYVTAANATLYALDPGDRLASLPFPTANEWTFNLSDNSDYAPGVDPSSGTIYLDIFSNDLVAVNPDGSLKWRFDANSDIDTTPAVAADGTIYFGSDNERAVFAVNPGGSELWRYVTGGEVDSSPTIGPDGTIYAGSDDNNVYALNPDGSLKWAFDAGSDVEAAPTIGADGTVYAVSQNSILYAINPDGTLKWFYSAGGASETKPAIDEINGIVYFGASDNNLYAINRYDPPRNIKDKFITSIRDGSDVKVGGEIVEVIDEDDWLKGDTLKGPWAIRIEVMRSLSVNANSNYDYTLFSWIRQCNELDCSDVIGTFFQDTRLKYAAKAPQMEQTIELTQTDHDDFDRFLFGFTTATASGDAQNAVIEYFQLSFIRAGDPEISIDSDWP